MEINDNKEEVTCRICGEQCKRIYGKHLKFKHDNMTTDEYKRLYPGAPIMALSDKEKTTINGGKHMKNEKYKKMFSEMFKGDKNPNHSSRATEQERRSRSPFSKDFIKYKGIENIEEHISSFAKQAIKDRISNTTLEYYVNKGYSIEESKDLLKNRQSTFSLEKCISKYGDEEGYKRWMDRQEKWQKNMLENGNVKCGYSKISQELFYNLLKNYDIENSDMSKVYFATKNKEYFISLKNEGFFIYDFVDLNNKKIIEFNGDLYHANPNIYEENDYPHPYYKNNGPSALETWNKDKLKIDIAKENGFDVLVVWDSEYRKDKNKVIEKCLNFLGIS
jgi:hypothetical protein